MRTEWTALSRERKNNDYCFFIYMRIPCHLGDWVGRGGNKIKEGLQNSVTEGRN